MRLFGITGTKGSGKDTSVETLVRDNPDQYIAIALADPLKANVRMIFDLTNAQTNDPVLKETIDRRWNRTPRELLQWFGTDCIRNQFDRDFWLKRFEATYRELERSDPNRTVLVTDIRFQNEADTIQRLGGSVVRVVRRSTVPADDSHVSETEMAGIVCDHTVVNDGSIEELNVRMRAIVCV